MPPRDDKVDTWMPWYVRDFLAATARLKPDAVGAYARLLSHLWLEHGYLDDDPEELAQLAGVTAEAWPEVWRKIARFFDANAGRLSQKRLLHELEEAREKRLKRREAGQAGAAGRWKVTRKKKAQGAMRSQCPSPSPSPSPSPTPSGGDGDPRARAPTPFAWALAAFCAAWRRRYGDDYAPTDRDRAFLGRVLQDLSPAQTAALPDCFVAYTRDEDRFLSEIQRHSLWFFCKQDGQNKYRVRPAPIRSESEARTALAVEQFVNGGIDGGQAR
jgi:uncharacterized protein YdaU (DUF1376 family)